MERIVLKVDGMSCGNCVRTITKAVASLPEVRDVAVDLAKKTVTVDYDPEQATLDKIKYEIEGQGYKVVA